MVWIKKIVVFIRKFALDISKARNNFLSVNNMANSNDSVSSLDENTQDGMIRNEGPVPYGYHPVCEARSPMSSASASDSGSADSDGGEADLVADVDNGDGDGDGQEPLALSRVGNVDWCRCGNCIAMATHTESLCCKEMAAIEHRMASGDSCIVDVPNFMAVCVNIVLDVALLSMMELRANSLVRSVPSR